MELSQELIEAHKLDENAVKAINAFGASIVADEKNALTESLKSKANEDAEKILGGAADNIKELTGLERNQGQKIADYIDSATKHHLQGKQTELDNLKKEYEDKVKKASGEDLEKIKATYQQEKDDLLKKYADFDTFKEKAEKTDSLQKKMSTLTLQVAYGQVRPGFPDTVNSYEAKAKWADFVKATNEKYVVELDENNEAVYIDRENKFKTGKLEDLVKADETIQALLEGRKQEGLGGKGAGEEQEIEGVPFKVKKDATNGEISKQVKEHLTKVEKLAITSKQYSARFQELYHKITKQKTAA